MMSHISFSTIQQSFKFQSVCISVGDDVTHLANNCREYEDPDEVADYREHVSDGPSEREREQKRREREDQL